MQFSRGSFMLQAALVGRVSKKVYLSPDPLLIFSLVYRSRPDHSRL